MKDRSSPTRTQTHEIAIDAPEEAVWKAIADGEELTRWFVDAAKVEPGVGGSIPAVMGRRRSRTEPDRRVGAEQDGCASP